MMKSIHFNFISVVNCGMPKKVSGIKFQGTTFTVGSELLFECESGYQLVEGNPKRKCQENGRWSGDDIVCKCK